MIIQRPCEWSDFYDKMVGKRGEGRWTAAPRTGGEGGAEQEGDEHEGKQRQQSEDEHALLERTPRLPFSSSSFSSLSPLCTARKGDGGNKHTRTQAGGGTPPPARAHALPVVPPPPPFDCNPKPLCRRRRLLHPHTHTTTHGDARSSQPSALLPPSPRRGRHGVAGALGLGGDLLA